MNVTLKYVDSLAAVQTLTLPALSVRGFDDPDEVAFFPPVRYDFVDGTARTAFKGFRRVITADLGVVSDAVSRRYIRAWLTANQRSIYYNSFGIGAEEIIVSLEDYESFQNEWLEGSSLFRRFILRVVEKVIRSEWSSYTPPSTVDIMYIKNKVKIEGTQASPEWFVTNTDKLETSESGNPYPNISLLSYAVTVITPPYQDAKINQVGEVQQNGSNIEFQLAVSDAGNPSDDGFYYADIIIGLEARA